MVVEPNDVDWTNEWAGCFEDRKHEDWDIVQENFEESVAQALDEEVVALQQVSELME